MPWQRLNQELLDRAVNIIKNNPDIMAVDLARRFGVDQQCLKYRLNERGYAYFKGKDKSPRWVKVSA